MSWITTTIVISIAIIGFIVVYRVLKSRAESKEEEMPIPDEE